MTKITIHINGKEIAAQISDEAAVELLQGKKTGYERVAKGEEYFCEDHDGFTVSCIEDGSVTCNTRYRNGNYTNDHTIGQGNTRADKLIAQLRQWQALNDALVDWSILRKRRWYIWYNYEDENIEVACHRSGRDMAVTYFSSEEKAKEAAEVFHDELTWYFTEYRSRLDEPVRVKDTQ
ncbi:MAG: hypothetical protein J1G06_08650 [Oscillospiraceae bacterium]|nr:hypothetical protein [Oscillospiraceae bacterium]